MGLTIWGSIGHQSEIVPNVQGCHLSNAQVEAVYEVTGWESLFIFDTIVFVLTVARTYKSRVRSNPGTGGRLSGYMFASDDDLFTVIFRDGALYFVIMALANLSNVLTYYLAEPILKGVLFTFASSLSATMMSRLMLNLYETADSPTFGNSNPLASAVTFSTHIPRIEFVSRHMGEGFDRDAEVGTEGMGSYFQDSGGVHDQDESTIDVIPRRLE